MRRRIPLVAGLLASVALAGPDAGQASDRHAAIVDGNKHWHR